MNVNCAEKDEMSRFILFENDKDEIIKEFAITIDDDTIFDLIELACSELPKNTSGYTRIARTIETAAVFGFMQGIDVSEEAHNQAIKEIFGVKEAEKSV